MNRYQARRATTDDVQQLIALWQAGQLPFLELEKRFTEFQIVEDEAGAVAAAIGLHIAGGDGEIHSETYLDFALTDTLRPLLWERLQVVAKTSGLFRLWTRETAPFWKKDAGFAEASESALAPLSAEFAPRNAHWLKLALRDQAGDPAALERQLAHFKEAERLQREKTLQRANFLKMLATLIAVLLFLFVLIGGIFLLKHPRAN